jgi:thioredoxin 1
MMKPGDFRTAEQFLVDLPHFGAHYVFAARNQVNEDAMSAPAEDERTPEPTHQQVEQMPGPVLLEFGAEHCGYCNALRPTLRALLTEFAGVRHVRIEDGKGKPLGRSFGVKLWPTLVFLRDGRILRQMSRPEAAEVRRAFEEVSSPA